MGIFSRNKDADEPDPNAGVPPIGTVPTDPVVVSATDGPMPETRDAFQAIRASGATSVDVVLVNVDLIEDEELLDLVEMEIRELASSCGLTVGKVGRLYQN